MGIRLQHFYCDDYCFDFYGYCILVGLWVNGNIKLSIYITEPFSHPIDGYSKSQTGVLCLSDQIILKMNDEFPVSSRNSSEI